MPKERMRLTPSTKGLLIDLLENARANNCDECNQFRITYSERISKVSSAEAVYRLAPEETDEETKWRNIVASRVRIETTTARRFILHLMQANHSPVGN